MGQVEGTARYYTRVVPFSVGSDRNTHSVDLRGRFYRQTISETKNGTAAGTRTLAGATDSCHLTGFIAVNNTANLPCTAHRQNCCAGQKSSREKKSHYCDLNDSWFILRFGGSLAKEINAAGVLRSSSLFPAEWRVRFLTEGLVKEC